MSKKKRNYATKTEIKTRKRYISQLVAEKEYRKDKTKILVDNNLVAILESGRFGKNKIDSSREVARILKGDKLIRLNMSQLKQIIPEIDNKVIKQLLSIIVESDVTRIVSKSAWIK